MSFQFGITFLVDGAENITVIVLIEIDIMTDFDEKGFLTEVIFIEEGYDLFGVFCLSREIF